ncbi:MAG: FAD-dependent oxidoreductase [Xanthobacteraceae bacterium]
MTQQNDTASVPDQSVYGPSWYSATMVPAADRVPLTYDFDAEVCIVGGGLAGLTAAREIARRGWSVAVLETRRVAWNASGRNCGFVLPGFAVAMDQVIARVGVDHAKALWSLSEMGLDYVRETIGETGMPGVDPVNGWLKVSKTDQIEDAVADLKLYGQVLGAEIEGWATERVRDVLRTRHYFHAMHFPRAFHMHPLNYALGLAAAAERAGARIFEGTPALSIDPDGVRKRIATPHGRIRASHIVLACNVHLGALMPRAAGTLMPIWTYMFVTAPLGPRLLEAIRYRGAVSDTDLADNHYRIVDGDRLLFSGRSTTWEADPRRYVGKLKADLAALYPRIGDVEVEYVWSGVLGSALHRMPQLGELTPGFWMASGFGGHGLNTTAMAGNILARAIVDGDDSWRLFSPYEFVWAGGKLGRAVKQIYYWWFRASERYEARQAREREEEVERASEREEPRFAERPQARVAPDVVAASDLPAEPVPDSLPADPALAELSAMTGAPGDEPPVREAVEPRGREAVEPRGREALEARLRGAADPNRRAPAIEDFDAVWPARQPPLASYGEDATQADRSRPIPPRGRRPSRDG